jgi:hypothetical protein
VQRTPVAGVHLESNLLDDRIVEEIIDSLTSRDAHEEEPGANRHLRKAYGHASGPIINKLT